MADITPYTNQIESARLGREVRGSIVSALLAMNDDINDDTESARSYAAASSASATTCQNISDNLQDAIDTVQNLNTTVTAAEGQRASAEQQRVAAETARESSETGYVAQARQYAQQAAQYASSDNAKLSESWAVGGTGTRYGEDSNNSKYWCDMASEIVTAGGVSTFNGRTGNVVPTSDDYTSTLIKRGSGTVETSLTSLESSVSTNTSNISANTSAIATNTNKIATNTTAISNNASALSALDAEIHDVEEGDITIPSGWTSGGHGRNYYYRLGNICMVLLDFTPSERVSGATVFTLPTACYPVRTVRYSVLPGVSRNSDDGNDHYVIINNNGTINYTGKGRVFNTFTFICNGG